MRYLLTLMFCLMPILAFAYELHTPRVRTWGYEIPITFEDTDKDYNIVMLFKNKPTEAEIKEMVTFWENKIAAEKLVKEPEIETLLKSEVERILRDKGYLTERQTWEILPDKEQLEVIR